MDRVNAALKRAKSATAPATRELTVYGCRGITLVRGEGARVWDDRGRVYLDCVAGHGAAVLGHAHPAIRKALAKQAGRLLSCTGAFGNDARAAFLGALFRHAPPGLARAFLCNSGAEAVEGGLKFARIHTGRTRIVAFRGGFHGRTFGALSATHAPRYRRGCGPLVPGFTHLPFNDPGALEGAVDGDTAAVILELVQGERGVFPADPAFVAAVREACDRAGALLVVDEVQTGMGRTGRLFACERYGLRPDVLCLAKGIAGGFPMGAVLVREGIEIPRGLHGSTFGGNPLACAAARAVLRRIVEDRLPGTAARKGAYLARRLRAAKPAAVREVRQAGLMIGVELRHRAAPYLSALAEEGVLALRSGATVVRLLPPLVIGWEEVERLADVLEEVLSRPLPLSGPPPA